MSKGLTAKVFSIAAEHGALSQSVNKQTVTVQGSLSGLPMALVGNRNFDYCPMVPDSRMCVEDGLVRFLGRFSYGVSFDMSDEAEAVSGTLGDMGMGTTQPVVFEADRNRISAITARVILWNSRDATSSEFQGRWAQAVKESALTNSGAELLKSFQEFLEVAGTNGTGEGIRDSGEFRALYANAFSAIRGAPNDEVRELWERYAFEGLIPLLHSRVEASALTTAVNDFVQSLQVYRVDQDQLVNDLAEKPVLSLEYQHNSPKGHKATSTVRLIFDKGLPNKWAFTANGAFTLYDARPPDSVPDASRWRDAQFGIEVRRSLGNLQGFGATSVSGSYYYQYQNSPSILTVTPGQAPLNITFTGLPATATEVFAEKGNLHIGQVRLELGSGTSNVRFPLSISYSNRTELIDRPTWNAQIGVSYDLDSLFAQ